MGGRSFLPGVGRFIRRNPIGMIGASVVGVMVLTALLADPLAPHDPISQLTLRLRPPSRAYLLGTDEFGRDILSRIIFGARISLTVGTASVAISLIGGVPIGLVSGYYGRWVDLLIMRVVDIMLSIPPLVLAVAISGLLGATLRNAILAIGIIYAPTFARLTRGAVLSTTRNDYVDAAKAVGASDLQIMLSHVAPNAAAPVIVHATLTLSTAILLEAALSFLGLGTPPPAPSWGTMLGAGRKYLETSPWVTIFPGMAIMLAILGFNLLGDALRDALDPRMRTV